MEKEQKEAIIEIKVGKDTYTFNLFYNSQLKKYAYTLLDFELIDLIKQFSNEKVKVLKNTASECNNQSENKRSEENGLTLTRTDEPPKIIIKKFGKDFKSGGGALTLGVDEVTTGKEQGGIHKRTHSDGWTIEGEIHEDYYTWVNDFKAEHPKFGKVWGNFEDKVFADSEEGFNDFFEKHKPHEWDYGDI